MRLNRPLHHVAWALLMWPVLSGCGPQGSQVRAAKGPIVFIEPEARSGSQVGQQFLAAYQQRNRGRCQARLQFAPVAGLQASDIHAALDQAQARRAQLLITTNGLNAQVAATYLPQVPQVFVSYAEPHQAGILGLRPGQAITGVALHDTLDALRLALLKQAFPKVRRIAVLADRYWPVPELTAPAGTQLELILADSPQELQNLIAAGRLAAFDAFYLPPTYLSDVAGQPLLDFLKATRKPAMHSSLDEVQAGALMSYAADTSFVFDAMADLVIRICSGEPAANIPVERPRRFVLAIRPDHDLGGQHVAMPVLSRADLTLR